MQTKQKQHGVSFLLFSSFWLAAVECVSYLHVCFSSEKRLGSGVRKHSWVWTAYPRDLESFMASVCARCPCASSLKSKTLRNGGPGAAEPAGRRTPGPLLTAHARAEPPMPRRAMHSVWRPPAARFPQLHVLRHTSVPRPRRESTAREMLVPIYAADCPLRRSPINNKSGRV